MGVKIIACFETLTSESEFNESQTEIIEEVGQLQLESDLMEVITPSENFLINLFPHVG